MTSSLMNFFIEKYLSNFVEIDTSQTKASIFSGTINLKNLKIKNEIFESLNLPNFEVVHGYIGNMTIILKMPTFYKYPIKVKIEKVFIHVRQKIIDKKSKEETIKSLEEYKHILLLNEEELRQKWEKVDNEEPNIFLQIINDLQLEINDVLLHYDDKISFKQVPFRFGILLNKMIIKTTDENYDIVENIRYQEINYKVFNIDGLSIFMDCYDNIAYFNSHPLSILTEKRLSQKNLLLTETKIKEYYSYCSAELKTYSKFKNAHQYILYKMELNVNISMNQNYLKNNLPRISVSIKLPKLNIRFTLKQLKTIFKTMAYYNLNQLYQTGIANEHYKEHYKKKITQEEKKLYVEKYIEYYKEKYYLKNGFLEFPEELSKFENCLSFEDIQKMRKIAYNQLDYLNIYVKKKDELKREEQKWYGKDVQKIEQLKEELDNLEKEQQSIENIINKDEDEKENMRERQEGLNKTFMEVNSSMLFSINEIRFIIYENAKINEEKIWEYKDILIKLIVSNFDVEGKIFKKSLKLSISLENAIVTQEKTKNKNFQKLFFGDLDNKGKVLYIEFEQNPDFEKSDYRFLMRGEKKLHILYDMHIFNYIMERIMNILNTKINFEEINNYEKEEVINKYIILGYSDTFFQHFNIDMHIELAYPIILLPLDAFSISNNKCIFLRLGKLEIFSDLPPRKEKGIEYKEIKKEELMYDIYHIKLLGTKLSTLTDCTPVNECAEYQEFETKIIRDFNLSIIFKKIIEIKNPFFDDVVCELDVSKVEMKLDEFQILFIIDYLGNFFKDTKTLFEENEIDKFLGIGEEEKDEEEMIKEFLKKYDESKEKNKTNDTILENISSELSDETEKKSEKDDKDDKDGIKSNNKTKESPLDNISIDNGKSNKEEDKRSFKLFEGINSINTEENKNTDENEEKKERKKDSYIRVNEIKKMKRSIRFKFTMNEMSLSIKKIHQDLKRENFLVLIQKVFEIKCLMMDNNDILTMLSMNNIYLYDKDVDEKKNNVISESFQCLINSSNNINNNTISFIDMTSLYRKINGCTDIETIFDMNDLNMVISFDSLLRIYQFMMYYYDKYNEMVYDIGHPQEKTDIEKSEQISMSSKYIFNRNSHKKLSSIITHSVSEKQNIKIIRSNNKKKNIRNTRSVINLLKKKKKMTLKKEVVNSNISIVYNMKNTIFKVPLNPKDLDTTIISFSFNLIYNQQMRNLYTNIYKIPQNLLIEKIYDIQDFSMNLLISKVYLDIEFKNDEPSQFIYENEKIVSNFRMSYFSSSFLYIPQKQSMTLVDINLEPLFCKFGVKQMGKMLEFYNKVLSFWFDFNNIKYIPYMKPEYIINGVVVIKPKKKKTFKECVLRIMISLEIRKGLKIQYKKIRAKIFNKKEKEVKVILDNISDFNSHYEMKVQFGKIIITFFDNVSAERRLLLNMNILQFFMKTISNNIIKDKNNLSNLIYEMLSGEDLPKEKYNFDTLANYSSMNFFLEINYFNLTKNKFEPLLEKIKIDNLSMQTTSYSRKKNKISINEMINFNISSDAIKVVNLFLLRYYQKEKEKEKKKIVKISSLTQKKINFSSKIITKNIECSKEISLLLVNYTELNIDIIFDFNRLRRFHLKAGESLTFYKKDLFLDRNQNNYSSILHAVMMGKSMIKRINFGENNTKQYKLKVKHKSKDYDLYITVKVNTSGIIRQVHFCPSISLYNDTNYKEIEIFIKNSKIKNKSLFITQNQKCYIPLTWALCDPPMSNVYMRIKNNIEPIKLYEYINEIIVEPLDEEEKRKIKIKIKKIEKEAKNNKKKYWNQNKIKSSISECNNRKDNKIVFFIEENQKIFFSLDYYFIQSKDIKQNSGKKENEEKLNNEEEYSYEFLVYIRPYATFFNQLPFNLVFTHGNSTEKTIKTLNKSFLYIDLLEENEQIRITFDYNGEKYRSQYFNISNTDSIELINNDDQQKENLTCCILKSSKMLQFEDSFNYEMNSLEFSSLSYEYTFFFKYIVMNKMPNSLWVKPLYRNNKRENIREIELKSWQLSIVNYDKFPNSYIIREENSKWSKHYNLKDVKKNGIVEIDNEIEKEDKTITNTKDISCIILWGKNYDNSKLLILQQQFIIHNKLNFDIYYKQEKDKEKTNHFLKKSTFESINHIKEKKIFRLGLFDINCGEFNYSSPFDITVLKTVDLLIKINELDKDKFDPRYVYTCDEKNYYILINIESHIFDDGLIYLSLTNPYFPSLTIENKTKTFVKIMENKNDPKPLIIQNNIKYNEKNEKFFPFVWKNNSEEKSTLICEIYGIQKNFSFLKYVNESFDIDFEEEDKSRETKSNISSESKARRYCKTITLSVYTKNKSSTRCLKIEEKDNFKLNENIKIKPETLFDKKKSNKVISSLYIIKFKGIGLSIIKNDSKELFYISLYSININFSSNLLNSEKNNSSKKTENLEFYLANFQIDYCLNDSIKYIIAPRKQILPSNSKRKIVNNSQLNFHEEKQKPSHENESFIKFLVTREIINYNKTMETSTIYLQIDFIIQEFICKIEQYTLTNLLNLIYEYMSLLDYSKKVNEEIIKEDLKLLNEKTSDRIKSIQKNKKDSKVLINNLYLSAMKIYITIRLNLSELYSSGFIKVITRVLGSIGNSLTRFSDVPLIFTEKGFENIYISLKDLLWIIFEDYKRRGTRQILTVLGSSDLIGNPVKLLQGIGTGFYELVNEPRKGFIHGPLQFGKGIAKGIGKLLSGIIGGTFGVVESITGTLYSATQSVTGSTHDDYLDEEEGPNNIASGALQGLYGGFKELANGVTGIVLHPIKGAKKSGVKGFFKGLGKGFVGLIISPFSALFRIVHSLATGTKNTINMIFGNSRKKIKRFRYPRVLQNGIQPYEFEKSEAKEALFKVMKTEVKYIEFAEYFCCANKGFDKELSLFIITDNKVIVLYETKKVIFLENKDNIKECEIHYINGDYLIKLCRKKGGGRGFKVKKEYYRIVFQIFDLLTKKKSNEYEQNSFKELSNVNNSFGENEDDNAYAIIVEDKSSQENNENDIEKIFAKEKAQEKQKTIGINNIYNINNINNIYNINNIQNVCQNNNHNENIIENQNRIFNRSINRETLKNDKSVYSETSENLSKDNNKNNMNKKKLENISIRNSSIGYNSKDKFLPNNFNL